MTSLGDEKYLHVLVLEDRRQTYRITMSTCHAARLAALARSWRRHNKKPTTTANQYSQTAAIDSRCVTHIFALTRDSVTLTFNPWRDMVMTHTQVKIKIEGLVQQIKWSNIKQSKVYGYSSSQCNIATPLRELTCHMGSHSVTCHPTEVTFPPLLQPKLVLDLATPEGCKAKMT